jgi:hypothetical protein
MRAPASPAHASPPPTAADAAELRDRLGFVDLRPDEGAVLAAIGAETQGLWPRELPRVFAHLDGHVDMVAIGGPRMTQRLQGLIAGYLQDAFSGAPTIDGLARARRMGAAHYHHHIPARWHVGMTSHLLRALLRALITDAASDGGGPSPDALLARVDAAVKVLFYDMAACLDAYDAAGQDERAQATAAWRATVSEVGATVAASSAALGRSLDARLSVAADQATAVAEVTSTLSELRQTAHQQLQQAQQLLQVAEASGAASARGADAVAATVDGMGAARDRVEAIQEKIGALSSQTDQIGDIIATVNEIAEQSKLLALNASIEAARAGESGRSFSVVANEMRDLAEQSKQATRAVRALLQGIREATREAVLAAEEGMGKVDQGARLAKQSGDAMAELGAVVGQSLDASRLIATAARQQGQGVSQVADAMGQIDRSMRAFEGGMGEVRGVVDRLASATAQMQAAVGEGGARSAA